LFCVAVRSDSDAAEGADARGIADTVAAASVTASALHYSEVFLDLLIFLLGDFAFRISLLQDI
jgi:hypothetical protein